MVFAFAVVVVPVLSTSSPSLCHLNSTFSASTVRNSDFIIPLKHRRRPSRSPTRLCARRLFRPRCASSSSDNQPSRKLLVVDLQEVLRVATERETGSFSERIAVDRQTAKAPTYVMYSSNSGYAASMQSIRDGGLIEPNALITLNGTELYQAGYSTPDPYFAKQLGTSWTPKPIEWTVGKFFDDEIDHISIDEEQMAVTIKCKGERPNIDFCSRVSKRLDEMGIAARVVLDQLSDETVLVVPTAGSPSLVVLFVQMMLGIPESDTFVFGGDALLNDCVQGKSNVGLCSASTEQSWEAFDGRVYVSKENGMKALMDGVIHHAVF